MKNNLFEVFDCAFANTHFGNVYSNNFANGTDRTVPACFSRN